MGSLKCFSNPTDQAADPVHPEPGEVRPELRHPRPHTFHTPADRAQRKERSAQQIRTPHPAGPQAGAAVAVGLQRYNRLNLPHNDGSFSVYLCSIR